MRPLRVFNRHRPRTQRHGTLRDLSGLPCQSPPPSPPFLFSCSSLPIIAAWFPLNLFLMSTKPRLHSKTACRNDLQLSGNSSVCCLRHSDGSFPFFSTQSDRIRQSFKASKRGSHVADIAELNDPMLNKRDCRENQSLGAGEVTGVRS